LRQQKRLKLFIIVDSRHHHDRISDFKIDNSHWDLGHYCTHSGLSVLSHSRE